ESVAHSLPSGEFALPAAEAAAARDVARRLGSPPSSAVLSSGGPGNGYHRRVARIALQVADALAHAHRLGVLHRDVKPSNLLLDAQGTVWVTDFGLAKVHDSAELTTPGEVVGTLRYLAPERLHGQGDARGDVYALGLTLYELLTLRPAFAGDGEQKQHLVSRILFEEPPRPRRLEPAIPRDLETIVLKATAKDPAQRYQSATELADDLRRFLEDRPIRARRAGALELAWRWCRRNPVVAGLLAAVALSMLSGSTVATVFAVRLAWAIQRADGAAAQAVKDRDLAEQEAGRGAASPAGGPAHLSPAPPDPAREGLAGGAGGQDSPPAAAARARARPGGGPARLRMVSAGPLVSPGSAHLRRRPGRGVPPHRAALPRPGSPAGNSRSPVGHGRGPRSPHVRRPDEGTPRRGLQRRRQAARVLQLCGRAGGTERDPAVGGRERPAGPGIPRSQRHGVASRPQSGRDAPCRPGQRRGVAVGGGRYRG